jgi:hypothetical protein
MELPPLPPGVVVIVYRFWARQRRDRRAEKKEG